jgi:hypothetical protein
MVHQMFFFPFQLSFLCRGCFASIVIRQQLHHRSSYLRWLNASDWVPAYELSAWTSSHQCEHLVLTDEGIANGWRVEYVPMDGRRYLAT